MYKAEFFWCKEQSFFFLKKMALTWHGGIVGPLVRFAEGHYGRLSLGFVVSEATQDASGLISGSTQKGGGRGRGLLSFGHFRTIRGWPQKQLSNTREFYAFEALR